MTLVDLRTGANEQIATLKTRLRGQLATETAAKAEAQASAEGLGA